MPEEVAALINIDEAATALRDYTSRLCLLLRRGPDPGAPAVGSWTVGNVANHVATGIENYADWLHGQDAPDIDNIKDMAQWNIETVRVSSPADLPDLADRIEAATFQFIQATQDHPTGSYVRWYAGNRIPVEVAVCMRLIEAAIHGLDIAAATGREWAIDSDSARTMSYGLAYIAPYFVEPDRLNLEGTLRMRIRGGAEVYYIIRDRELRVATWGPKPGWHLSVDPVAWVLVATGRRNEWIAALRGKILGWGRRPALPFKLRAASFQG